MSLNKSWFKASELFNSLPNGLFTNFNGMEVSGELSYHGYLNVDLEIPVSMIFESNLMQKNFKVTKYGDTDFRLLNDPFIHQVFENDEMVKEIILGPENRDFRSFEQIPVSLKNSILMSEDGWFFEHGGFSIGAFRESIITNIKTKRFTRGGSTISMQLVKNLFLSRKKNIARKAEELLIVWFIEGQRIISKERMFEIYVNIIEWGPGIYGATEAARFYFNKDVSALTLAECIYLAAIIPSPKNFRYLFNEDGTFREYILNYYALVVKRMVEHEKITQEEADAVVPKVLLTGEAKEIPIKKEKTKK
jgi:membrane peptidoglycan carboxypeptidase